MAIPKIIGAQRDFSAGELDVSMKRSDDHPIMKLGARQLSNFRILNSGAALTRPGRSALFLESGRVEEILMAPGQIFYLVFGNQYLRVYNAVGAQVFSTITLGDGTSNIPWTTATVKNIVYVIAPQPQFKIYIAYADAAPANVPQVLSWDGVSQTSTWTLNTYIESITGGGQKRTLFDRLSPQNITMQPSATTGSVTLTFSGGGVLVPGMIGTRFRYAGRQVLLTAITSPMVGTATVIEPLPPGQILTLNAPVGSFTTGDVVNGSVTGAQGVVTASPATQTLYGIPSPNYNVGDAVTGGTSGATGIITAVAFFGFFSPYIVVHLSTSTFFVNGETVTDTNTTATFTAIITGGGSSTTLTVQILPTATGFIKTFTTSDLVVGPSGSSAISGVSTTTPQPISIWDDEVMNTFRGFPKSVFFDQSRLGFNNFPSLPSGIAWSAIGLPTDLYVGALPDNAIFELVPGKSQVQFVQPGLEGSEFVFCNNAIYYIPITPANPLVPGSVAFNQISSEGAQPNVQPRQANQSIVYMKAGGVKVGAVQVPGAYYRPYVIDDVSEYHGHLFTASPVIAIAIPSASNHFEELYAYILFANGTLAIGKYQIRSGLLDVGPDGKPKIGWLPWSGAGAVNYISALGADLIFTTTYSLGGAPYTTEDTLNNYTAEDGVSVYTSSTVVSVVEKLDNTQFLDAAVFVNNMPPALAGGSGPLFTFPGPNCSVFLIDLGTRFMGTYNVDGNGNLIPQNIGGENLSSPNLVAGQTWTAILEVFAPDAQPGQDVRQRMLGRRISRMGTYVSNSTGFVMARLFSGPLTPTSPALGTIMNIRRISTYNIGDDATQPPPLREEMQRWRPLGRSFDPRVAVIKDTPGPLVVHEIGIEVSL